MKDFDTDLAAAVEADRTFRIRGQEFTFGPRVDANVLAKFEDARFDTETTSVQTIELCDELICSCLNGEEKKWRELRKSADPPIDYRDMLDLVAHIMEVTSARPTEKPGDSGTTSGKTGTPSKVASSSTVAS